MKISDFISRTEEKRETDVLLVHMDPLYNCANFYYNLGLLYIAGYLKSQNYRVKCLGPFEINNMTPEQVKCYFLATKPPVVGFYTISDNIHPVGDFAALIKKWSPGTVVVVGGPYATSLREKILSHPAFDICVPGEGEFTMAKIADWKIKNDIKPEDIPGIIYKTGEKTELTSEPQPIKDIDSLPIPDQSMVNVMKSHIFQVSTGRGCPYKCIFCFQKVHGTHRTRNMKNVVEEIAFNLETNRYKGFSIIDDLFITDPERVREFVKLLGIYRNKSGRKFTFFCQGRVNVLDKNPELVEMLKSVGLTKIQIGFESGHDEMLKRYNKQITVEQIKRVVKRIIDVGEITITGNFILGGPCENRETTEATKKLIRELTDMGPGIFEPSISHLVPYPGTEIAENPEKYGLEIIDDRLNCGAGNDVCVVSKSMGVSELRKAYAELNREIFESQKRNVKNIDRKLLLKHIEWYADYNTATIWSQFIINNKLLTEYYNFVVTKRYRSFDAISRERLYHWYPQRVIETRMYSEDGRSMILPPGTEEAAVLDVPEEILIYELSSGKLPVSSMITEFRKSKKIDLTDDEILETYFIPLFRKLDRSYHLVFHSYGG
jgi:anaerobic magnesium-protoporphyrin IX monomethyl ester cyclase